MYDTQQGSARFYRRWALGAAVVLGVGMLTVQYPAAATQKEGHAGRHAAKHLREATHEVNEATEAFNAVMSRRETAIPLRIAERAKAVAIFPKVVEAAFIVGGRGGDGVITARTPRGWSAPAFFRLGGATVGLQLGGRSSHVVLVFRSEKAIDKLLADRLEFGAEATAVAGPVETETANVSAVPDDHVLVYAEAKGLFAGAALKGGVISPDNKLNRDIYRLTAADILRGGEVSPVPLFAKPLWESLDRYLARKS